MSRFSFPFPSLLKAANVEASIEEVPLAPQVALDPVHEDFSEASTPELSDESALVVQARRDPSAFGVLYQRYVDRIYAYIYHRVGNEQDTEDLTARTFYRALDKFDTYQDRGLPFGAWLFRIAHNLVANWHRDRSRRSFMSLDKLWSHWKEDDDPERTAEKNEENGALWAAIDRLPKDRRELIFYKFSTPLSNIEIGELMDKSESAIKSLYFRTLAALRTDLEGKGWTADFLGHGHDQVNEAKTT